MLIELRDAVAAELAEQGKTDWAAQEFEHLRTYEAAADPARPVAAHLGHPQGAQPQALAAVRELWTVRDHIARRRDIAPGRILPDSAIIDAATADPSTVEDLAKLPIFGGSKQRRSAQVWLDALEAARNNPEPPEASEPQTGPPPAVRWSKRKPEAAARLEAARTALTELSAPVTVPTENLLSPDLVRRLCWDWQDPSATRPSRRSTNSCATPGRGRGSAS